MATTRRLNKPVAIEILAKRQESDDVYTLDFSFPGLNPRPGQFLLVWIPQVDEIPMSVSCINNEDDIYGISVMIVGEATKALCSKEPGDMIGIRGPFGNGYSLDVEGIKPCIIGGGIGIASVNPLVHHFLENDITPVVINAARTRSALTFHEDYARNPKLHGSYHSATDDGSGGHKGFASDVFLHLLESKKIDATKLYTCGPEPMILALKRLAGSKGLSIEASLERMMRCGVGLCGLCCTDHDGLMVCKDGPVFNEAQLDRIVELGKYHRDFSGFKKHF